MSAAFDLPGSLEGLRSRSTLGGGADTDFRPEIGYSLIRERPGASGVSWLVGVGEFSVSDRPKDVLIAHSLGSCLGLSVYDPVLRLGGMAHCMLPLSKQNPMRASERPALYVDTGIQVLLEHLFGLGARKENLVIKAAGCAAILHDNGMFRIGEKNYAVLRKVLWKNDLLVTSEETGGSAPRTVSLEIKTGRTFVQSGGQHREL
ncbi:MAG: chemotaxis protein CheD [Candidatus Omnitrophica bacterium]|nr:Chemoreceptor glutamine deamidase CheD [bacterium]NUN94637.1 chemotaxis protein CheD [Candidatus Omnitrophota bacterium]